MIVYSIGNLVEPKVPLVINRYIPAEHVMQLKPHKASVELQGLDPAINRINTYYPITCKITDYDKVPFKWREPSNEHIQKRFKKLLAEGWEVIKEPDFETTGLMAIKKGLKVFRTITGNKDYNIPYKSPKEGTIIPPSMLRGYITQICAEGETPIELDSLVFDPPLFSQPSQNRFSLKIFTEEYLYYYLNINLIKLCE